MEKGCNKAKSGKREALWILSTVYCDSLPQYFQQCPFRSTIRVNAMLCLFHCSYCLLPELWNEEVTSVRVCVHAGYMTGKLEFFNRMCSLEVIRIIFRFIKGVRDTDCHFSVLPSICHILHCLSLVWGRWENCHETCTAHCFAEEWRGLVKQLTPNYKSTFAVDSFINYISYFFVFTISHDKQDSRRFGGTYQNTIKHYLLHIF